MKKSGWRKIGNVLIAATFGIILGIFAQHIFGISYEASLFVTAGSSFIVSMFLCVSMTYSRQIICHHGKIIACYPIINGIRFRPIKDGVRMEYPCGAVRTIMNSFYD